MHSVIIIGGGIIGLSTAYYLRKAGAEVTVLEKGTLEDNCSFGNAGMIVPSHFVPLAAPGVLEQGIRWMFDSKSPFYVRPSLNPALISWGLKFIKSANRSNVERAAIPLRDLSLFSSGLYQEMANEPGFGFGLHNNGILMLSKTRKMADEEAELAERAKALGLDVSILTPTQCRDLQPELDLAVEGAVLYRCDAHLTPFLLMKQLTEHLESSGVRILRNHEVTGFGHNNGKINSVHVHNNLFESDEVVIAGGAWSPAITKLAGLRIPMMPGKGYSFMYDEPNQRMSIASLLMEARVSVTPMGKQIRFGGTMELGPLNDAVNMQRVRGIVEAIPKYFPDLAPSLPAKESVWHGFRPCSPDGLPYIGRTKAYQNVVIAGGHGMMGLSLGPATGKLVSEVILGQPTSISINAFNPDRFS